MRRLLTYLRPYWAVVCVSMVLLLGDSLLQIAGPLLTKTAVDRYFVPTTVRTLALPFLDPYLSKDAFTGLAQLAGLYALTLLLGFFLDFGQTYMMQWTGQKAMFDLRRQLMAHLQTLDIAYFDVNPVGRLVTRVTTDADVLNDLFASGLVTIVGDLLMLSFVIVAMVRLSPGMTGADACRDADRRAGHHAIPPHRAAELSPHPGRDCEDQRLFTGARRRHYGSAVVQSRSSGAAKSSNTSIAITCWPTRIRSSLTAGFIRSWSFLACSRWR